MALITLMMITSVLGMPNNDHKYLGYWLQMTKESSTGTTIREQAKKCHAEDYKTLNVCFDSLSKLKIERNLPVYKPKKD